MAPTAKHLLPVAVLVVVIAVWQGLTALLSIPAYVVPSPLNIWHALLDNGPVVANNIVVTMIEAVLGFVLGSAAGFVLGLALSRSRLVAMSLLPYVVGSNAVPVVAIAPLVVLWFGHGILSKVIVAAFLCFFPLAINTYRGLSETPEAFRDLFQLYGASRLQYLLKAQLPHASALIFTGAKLNATYAVIGAIVAEFIGATAGLGFGMLNATYNLDVPRLWAYLVVSVVLGMSFYCLVWAVEQFGFRKYRSVHK
jgi:NitT/TauT family transport system permease protein